MPKLKPKMTSLVARAKSFITPSASNTQLATAAANGFHTAKTETELFPATDPAVDGDECLRDCEDCTVHLPNKWSIDEEDKLYGHVKGWDTHLIVGTGKSDWVRDVTDEKGSVMEAVGKVGMELKNGKVMLSACNMPMVGDCEASPVILLPAWQMIDEVRPAEVPELMREVVERAVTNVSALRRKEELHQASKNGTEVQQQEAEEGGEEDGPDVNGLHIGDTNGTVPSATDATPAPSISPIISSKFNLKPCPHRAIILMCSHKTRDARCGQSAPLLRKEFERVLRPMGLYRDLQDDRPGGVGIYYINHVGGHKYSANVMVYRREGRKMEGSDEEIDGAPLSSQAVQGIWLARVRPEDCENIVRFTVLQGKLVKPQRQLRGGFDRERGLISW